MHEQGKQHFLDATLAYKRAVLNCIKYLAKFGYTEEQVYLLLSCCPCEGRISGIVDVPNAVATLAIPLAIFDQEQKEQPQLLILASSPPQPFVSLAVRWAARVTQTLCLISTQYLLD